MYTELFIMIKRQLQLIACLILLQNLHPSSSTLIDLCSNVRQMSEVCAASSNVSVSTANTSCQCVGERGPRGQRGRPGKNGEIDYDILNERIDARLEADSNRRMRAVRRPAEVLIQRLDRVEELLSWYKASNGLRYRVFPERVTYAQAMEACTSAGATLAAVGARDAVVRRELGNLVRNSADVTIWIGLDDIKSEGKFVWADGVTMVGDKVNWSKGQPDNAGDGEHCVTFQKEYGYRANDAPCDTAVAYLCEKRSID